MKKNIIYASIAIVILILAGLYFWMGLGKSDQQIEIADQPDTEWGSPELAMQEAEKAAATIPASGKPHTDSETGLSFAYPDGMSVSSFAEGEDEGESERVILIQDAAKSIGMQISAMPFSDPMTSLTKERIEGDLEISISNYSIINIGKASDIQAVTFLSGDSVKYREVWFAKNDMLFVAKSYQSSEALIVAILKTLSL